MLNPVRIVRGVSVIQGPRDPPIEEGLRTNPPPLDASRPRQAGLLALPDGHRPRGHPGPAPEQRWRENLLVLTWGLVRVGSCWLNLG